MNKHLLKVVLLFLCISFVISLPAKVSAQEAFIITQYDIEIISNPDNSFNYTEKITVVFSEDRHGIFRTIPKKGGSLRYMISDIEVASDPFVIQQDSLNTIIQIGDANREISGEKTYFISYKLTFEKDDDTSADIVNLDLVGNMWDTQINDVTINFYYPKANAVPTQYNVYNGQYNSKDETGTIVTEQSDHLTIRNKNILSNFDSITLVAKFPENTFNLAAKLPDPYKFQDYNAEIRVKKDRIVEYKEVFTLQIIDEGILPYYIIPLTDQDLSPLTVRNVRHNGIRQSTSNIQQGVFAIPLTKNGVNTIEYTVYYEADKDQSNDLLPLMLFSNYRDIPLNGAKIKIISPFSAISYKTIVSVLKEGGEAAVIQNTQGDVINIEISDTLKTGEGIYIDLVYPENSFGIALHPFTVISVIFGILLLLSGFFLYRKYGKDDVVSPVIEFYPPDNLSSASIGYVINRVMDPIDITSMLLYWASHNHVHFIATGKNDFEITYNSDLEDTHPKWEQNAFGKLKDLIEQSDGNISKESLQKQFYQVAGKIQSAVPLYFKNDRSLDDKKSIGISGLLCFLSALFIGVFMGFVVFTGIEEFLPSAIAGIIIGVISVFCYAWLRFLVNGWFRRHIAANYALAFVFILFIVFLLFVVIILSLFIMTTVQLPALVMNLLIAVALQATAVFTIKRSIYGQRLLERVVGFREFLIVAEKERLEALLEDNPEYYYQILPFALVLNVSDIWEKKFSGFQMVEPVWYQGSYPGYVFSYLAISSFAQNSTAALAHYTAPPSSSGTGGFSGGGGGGGFSGGGGGGGGGGSW